MTDQCLEDYKRDVTEGLIAEIARLRKALRLARARIEYLGTVCPGPTHYDANARTFLPMIDVVLDVQTAPSNP